MQTDAEMPSDATNDETSDAMTMANDGGMSDESSSEMGVDTSSAEKSFEVRSKKSKKAKPAKRSANKSKKSVAEILKASSEKGSSEEKSSEENSSAGMDLASDETTTPSRLATHAEIRETIESVSSATQVAWEAAHLAFDENEIPETDPEAETKDDQMAANSDSTNSDDEIEETELGLDAAVTSAIEQSIEQMGFAALESENSENESSETNFLNGIELSDDLLSEESDSSDAEDSDLDLSSDVDASLDSEDDSEYEMSAGSATEIKGEAETDTEIHGEIEDPADNDADAQPTEFIEADHLVSIVESMLFSTDKPVSIATIKQMFKGSNVRTKDITRALDILASDYAAPTRGVTLEEINGGFQLRSKVDNSEYLRRLQKSRPFRLSGPALEVMSIVAYKQPVTKHEIDEIRGVESGHLLRALMERGMVNFAGKSDLPGKPMAYGTTRKFLEIFGLRNLKELPTLTEIDEILPQGIGETEEKEKLSDLTGQLSTELTSSYSEGEDELDAINSDLLAIDTTSEFFEQEKQRERDRKERDKAQDLREKIVMGDEVEEKDRRWLDRYEARLLAMEQAAASGTPISIPNEEGDSAPEIGAALEALSADADLVEEESDELSMSALEESDESEDDQDSEDEPSDDTSSNSEISMAAASGFAEGMSLDDMPKFEVADEIITPDSVGESEEIAEEEAEMLDDLEAVLDWNEDDESEDSELGEIGSAKDASSDSSSAEEAEEDLVFESSVEGGSDGGHDGGSDAEPEAEL